MAFNKSVFRFAQGATYADRSMPCKMLATPSAQCMGIAASHKWVASVYGTGNNVLVLPLDHKEFKRNDNPPVVTAHGQAITDLRFSPWDGNLLVTGSEDGYVKSFEIPADGMTANVSAPKAKIELKSPIRHMAFHPSAEGVLAVGCKNGLKILDLNKGEIKSVPPLIHPHIYISKYAVLPFFICRVLCPQALLRPLILEDERMRG